jgi:hypothetical protein
MRVVIWSTKTKKMKTMKTTTLIAAKQAILIVTIFLGFQIQHGLAKSPAYNGPAKSSSEISNLVLASPKSSSVVDIVPENSLNINAFAPSLPKEASIDNENSYEITPELLKNLAPSTPAEADINDSTLQIDVNLKAVKFLVPCEADPYIY